MPKLIVYVKADTWRRVEAAAEGEDAAALARRISVAAIEIFTERSEADAPSRAEREELVVPAEASAQGQVGATPRTPVQSDPHLKPDWKK